MGLRQPGSSFKPFVYASAFKKGFTTETVLWDVKTEFNPNCSPLANQSKDIYGLSCYHPMNYDENFRGKVTLRSAISQSLNLPSVKLLYLTGLNESLQTARDLGITTLNEPERYGLSLVLGGGEVTLLEHTNAYAGFAREGVTKDTMAILKIEDSKGKVIEENTENKGRRVLEKEPIRLLTGVLSDNSARAYIFGANNYLTLGDRQVAAKTGTTNDYHDAWTMGFTPQVAVGVWVGNNDNTAMSSGADGSQIAAPIWQKMMKFLLKDKPVEAFKTTELNTCDRPMLCGSLASEQIVKIDKMSGLLATEYTPYTQIEDRKYMQVHDILHFVDKDNLSADQPEAPQNDPQYSLWETPVQAWAVKENYLTEAPPTEYDNIHLEEDQPNLIIITPLPGQKIEGQQLSVDITASAKRGIKKVEYYIDNKLITIKEDISDTNINLTDLVSGIYNLIVKVKDNLENTTTKSVDFKI